MNIKKELFEAMFDEIYELSPETAVKDCEKICEDFALKFYIWMKENDTEQNAERWFGFSDRDMLNTFKETL